jgi:hypothetical protein
MVALAYLGAVASEFIWSFGEERNEYRHLFLWLV